MRGGTATVARGCHRTASLPSAAEVVAEAGSESFCFKEGRASPEAVAYEHGIRLFVCLHSAYTENNILNGIWFLYRQLA